VAGAIFFADCGRWRRRHHLPRHVFIHTPIEPKPFYCDLDSPLFVDLLRRLLDPAGGGAAAPPTLHVTEMLPAPGEMWVKDDRGRYASEILLHLSGPWSASIRAHRNGPHFPIGRSILSHLHRMAVHHPQRLLSHHWTRCWQSLFRRSELLTPAAGRCSARWLDSFLRSVAAARASCGDDFFNRRSHSADAVQVA
jgi:hypothetical protein